LICREIVHVQTTILLNSPAETVRHIRLCAGCWLSRPCPKIGASSTGGFIVDGLAPFCSGCIALYYALLSLIVFILATGFRHQLHPWRVRAKLGPRRIVVSTFGLLLGFMATSVTSWPDHAPSTCTDFQAHDFLRCWKGGANWACLRCGF
jgi:hypothetical protein